MVIMKSHGEIRVNIEEIKRRISHKRQRFERMKKEAKSKGQVSNMMCCNVVLSELQDFEDFINELE